MRLALLSFLIFLLSAFFVPAAFAYVSPGTPAGYVNDFGGMLNPEEKDTLEATLRNFHDQNGGQIAVVTISTLSGDTIEGYANALFREWGIGEKDKNNGVLLLVAKEERKVRIEVGYGYEGDLTDARSSEIIRDTIVPYFKQEQYGLGILSGVRDIITALTGGAAQHPSPAPSDQIRSSLFSLLENNWLFIFIVIYTFCVWLASALSRSKEWWAGGIVGGVIGLLVSIFIGFVFSGLIVTILLVLLGLFFDYAVSKGYSNSIHRGTTPPWWTGGSWGGGGGGFSGGGGFGGFGGGSSGGGGASGSW